MEKGLERMLVDGAGKLGAKLGAEEVRRFSVYLEELKAWNKRISLTSIVNDRDVVVRHFLDSLVPLRFIEGIESLLDIGAGAGFPGLPLKIVSPGLRVVLVDSVAKKVHFMRHIIRKLGLGAGAEAIQARVEDPVFLEKHSGAYGCVVSRAFSSLGEFLDFAVPYTKSGGIVISMKGPKAADELASLGPLPGGLYGCEVMKVEVPFSGRATTLVIFKKKGA